MPSEQSPGMCAAVKIPAVLRIFIGELLQEQRAGKGMTWTKWLLTDAMRSQSLLLPIRGLIEKWILNPWRIAVSRIFPAAVNGAVIQSQAKAELTVAGINICEGKCCLGRKVWTFIIYARSKEYMRVGRKQECRLAFLRFRGSCLKD